MTINSSLILSVINMRPIVRWSIYHSMPAIKTNKTHIINWYFTASIQCHKRASIRTVWRAKKINDLAGTPFWYWSMFNVQWLTYASNKIVEDCGISIWHRLFSVHVIDRLDWTTIRRAVSSILNLLRARQCSHFYTFFIVFHKKKLIEPNQNMILLCNECTDRTA